jgi:ferredoxin
VARDGFCLDLEPPTGEAAVVGRDALDALIAVLRADGYEVIGPVRRDGVIALAPVTTLGDLPTGWGDEQQPGHYRLVGRDDDALFGYAVGPHSWKAELFPPRADLYEVRRSGSGGFEVQASPPDDRPRAFLGVRACEVAALAVQDRVFLEGATRDPVYARRRAQAVVIAVDCGDPSSSCFCASMGTGPRVTGGFDLALTELATGDALVVRVGSDRGAALLARIPHRTPTRDELDASREVSRSAEQLLRRRLDTTGLRELLVAEVEHAEWDAVAERCLACGNCTSVCPTCFCSSVEEVTDLAGERAVRRRSWASCFSQQFSYLNGGTARAGIGARYRQWLSHKLSTWFDQYGTSGCVGCGRCITWCPVGIDLTREVVALRTRPSSATAVGMSLAEEL